MLVKTLRKLLENTGTKIKKVNFVNDVDPFLLSPTKIRLNLETFKSEDDIIKAVLEQRQVKPITIILNLKNKSCFTRVGRKQYKLK